MTRKRVTAVIVIGLCLGVASCRPLEPETTREGPLAFAKSEFTDAVPLDYGNLVSVTPHPEQAHWAALWFEKEDRTIAVVWVNVVRGEILEDVCQIRRR